MANLVTPPYPISPVEEKIIEFKGLNRKPYVEEGEMSDMLNLTADDYPLLSPRKLRGTYKLPDDVERPLKIISKDYKLAMIATDKKENPDDPDEVARISFYYGGEKITEVDNLQAGSSMVAINTKICFFPQNTYIEIIGGQIQKEGGVTKYNSLEESYTAEPQAALSIDIGNEAATINMPGAHGFKYDDSITLKGSYVYQGASGSVSVRIDTACAIESVDETTYAIKIMPEVFLDAISAGATSVTFIGDIKRSLPSGLDFIMEWNNRLWGASSDDNTIYACKLGDPTNWQYFQGTGLDSYYAQQGTDGAWTGAGEYSNHIMFFKEDSVCKVYGTAPSNYQVQNVQCYGVEDGSRKSVVTINDKVFYKSAIGIMAYDGGIPYRISEKFNTEFRNVVAGTEGTKYYASIQAANDGYHLMVLDIDKAMWHREDRTRYRDTCTINNRLYYIEYSGDYPVCDINVFCDDYLLVGSDTVTGDVKIVNPSAVSEAYVDKEGYETIEWMATFGPFDEYMEYHRIYSSLTLRLVVYTDSDVRVYISEDEKDWELVKDIKPVETHGEKIPIVPRRCDRYSIKIEGKGKCEIKSLTRRWRKGSHNKTASGRYR